MCINWGHAKVPLKQKHLKLSKSCPQKSIFCLSDSAGLGFYSYKVIKSSSSLDSKLLCLLGICINMLLTISSFPESRDHIFEMAVNVTIRIRFELWCNRKEPGIPDLHLNPSGFCMGKKHSQTASTSAHIRSCCSALMDLLTLTCSRGANDKLPSLR